MKFSPRDSISRLLSLGNAIAFENYFLFVMSLAFAVVCLLGPANSAVASGRETRNVTAKDASQPAARRSVPAVRPALAFEPNVGQTDAAARFIAHGAGFDVILQADGAKLNFKSMQTTKDGSHADPWPLSLRLAGAKPEPSLGATEKLVGTSSYFPYSDAKTWRANVPNFGRVTYGSVYPGIDLAFYGRDSRLEYDFTVAAGADVHAIRLALDGVESASVNATGDLNLAGKEHSATFLKPVAYQLAADGKTRQTVDVEYRLGAVNAHKEADISFAVGRYDRKRPLVIDPVLRYGEYLPTTTCCGYDAAGVQVDAAGNAYALSSAGGGGFSVIKVDPQGNVLSTINVGSNATDTYAYGMALDSGNNIYVTGHAASGLPTTANAYQPNRTGANAFLSVLKADGSGLSYSTYFGGSNSETAEAVAVDSSGSAYIAGYTISHDLPTTSGVFQTASPKGTSPCNSGFVAKFNPAASGAASLVYSSYLGNVGGANDYLYGIAVDPTGAAYVTGNVQSNFPVSGSGYNYSSYGASPGDPMVYVVKLKPDASGLAYSSQIGPGTGNGIAIDGTGAAYVAGVANEDDFPTTSGAYDAQYPGPFATKLSADGSSLIYSTFLGGPGSANNLQSPATSIALPPNCASNCAATIAGVTNTLDFPLVNAIDSTPPAFRSAFLVQLAPTGTSATLSTYYGGVSAYVETSGYQSPAVALDGSGDVFLALNAVGKDFASTSQIPANATYEYLAKISPATASLSLLTPLALDLGPVYVGQPSTVSTSRNITLRNLGSKAIGSLAFSIDDTEFTQTNDCGTTLAAGSQCTFQMTFTPAAIGSRAATLTIASDAPNSPVTSALTGTGSDAAYLRFSAQSLTFGDQALNTTSAAQSFTITNVGSQPAALSTPFTISSSPATNGFAILSNCPATLGIGASCTAAVSFSPLLATVYTGTVQSLSGNPSDSISVTGTGVATSGSGSLSTSSSTVNFGATPVGKQIGLPGTYIYLYNNGTEPVTVNTLSLARSGTTDYTADFSIFQTGCTRFSSLSVQTPESLDAQTSCYIQVLFTPSAATTEQVTLNVANSTAVSPVAITLIGTGTTATQVLEFTPSNAEFGDQPLGYPSAVQNFYVSNSGNTPFMIDRVIANGDFLVFDNNCSHGTIPPGQNQCNFTVAFKPTALGARTGTITIYDTAGNPQVLGLAGTGIAATGSLTLENTPVVFTAQAKGTTSPSQYLYLVNTGNKPVQASTVAVTGDFAVTYNQCAGTLIAPGRSCEVDVAFTPMQTSGTETGTLTIATAAGSYTAPLSGIAEVATQAVSFTPTSIDFGSIQTGLTSNSGAGTNPHVWIRNTGTEPVTFNANATVSANFTITGNTCGGNGNILAPNSSCEIDVQFNAPSIPGVSTGTLTLSDTASTGTQSIPITATAVTTPPGTYFEPTEVAFTQQPVGSVSAISLPIYLANTSAAAIPIASVTASGDFILPADAGNCLSGGLPAQTTPASPGYCYTHVQFAPTAAGYRTGTLTLKDASNKTYSVPLAGFATAESNSAYLSQDSLVFVDEVAGVPLANIHADTPQSIALYNTSNLPLTVGNLTGAVIGDFTLQTPGSDQCSNRPVPANSSCYVYVAFTPSTPGHKTGSINFPVTYADNSKATLSLTLSGNGVAPVEHATLSATSVNFADETVGVVYPTTGADSPFAFTFTNDGNITLIVGKFSQTDSTDFSALAPYGRDNCTDASLAPAATCTVTLVFQPFSAGAKSSTATFPFHYMDNTNTAGSLTATLAGKGIAANNAVTISPSVSQFLMEVVNTQDTATLFAVMNNGNEPVIAGAASVTSNFTLAYDGCKGGTINPGRTCQVQVQFTPVSSSTSYSTTQYNGTLTVPIAGGATLTAALSGTGIPASQQISLSQPSINFGSVDVGSSSAQLSAELVNRGPSLAGTGAVTITSVVLGGINASDFLFTKACPASLQGRQTCLLNATFSPAAGSLGTRTATVTVTYGSGGTLVLALTGNGTNPVPQATVFPATLNFGGQGVATISPVQTFNVTNTGSANLVLGTLAISSPTIFPVQYDSCSGRILTPSQRCQVGISFDPLVGGAVSATVTIPSNAATTTVSLTGTGGSGGPQILLTPALLAFANQAVTTASASQTIIVRNTGGSPLTGLSIGVNGTNSGEFLETTTCTSTLAASASCLVSIRFEPTAVGPRSAVLYFNDNAKDSPQKAVLSGTGTQASQTISFTGLSSTTYGAVPFALTATASSGLAVVYTVAGPATVSGSTLTITGAGTVKVTASQAGNANFAAAPPVSQLFTVAPANLTVAANNATRAYGTANPAFTYTFRGFQYSDTSAVVAGTATLTSAANATSLAGTYPITFATESLTAANYTFTYVGGTLTVTNGVAASPTFLPGTGSYTAAQTVVLADTTPGAAIYYTTDGSVPNANSNRYGGAFSIGTNQTLKAAAIATGYTISPVASATYTFVPLTPSPTSVVFGDQNNETTSAVKAVTITNPGLNPISGLTPSFAGMNTSDFAIVSNGACGGTLAPGGSCTYSITFTPQDTGARAASLRVSYNGTGSPVSVGLSGTGVALTPNFSYQPSTSTYGQVVSVSVALSGNPTPTGSFTYSVDGGSARTVPIGNNPVSLTAGVLAAGPHTVVVTYSGDSLYAPATAPVNLSVAKAPLTATAANVTRQFGAANPAFTYAVTGFVNNDTSAVVSGTATLSTTATPSSAPGTYPITFATEGLAASNYNFTYLAGSLTVGMMRQTITFGPLSGKTYGASPFVLTATASSGLAVSYTVTGPATVSGSTLAITGAGLVTITASQAGNADYSAAPPVSESFTVAKAILTATAANLSRMFGAANPTLTYTTTGFVNGDTGSVVSGTANLITTATPKSIPGTYPVTFATEGLNSANYSFAYVAGTLTIGSLPTITFAPLSNVTYGASPITLIATASDGLPVSFTVTGPAAVSGSTLTITGVGVITITASQAGNATYPAATSVSQSFSVAKAPLTVTASSASRSYGATNPAFTFVTAGFVNGDTASVVSGTATLTTTATSTSAAGAYPITFGTESLAAANYSFTYVAGTLTIGTAQQTITFGALPNTIYGASPITLAATASSGLPVSYTVSGPATLSGSMLTVTGAGQVTVTAVQAGNSNYAAAPSIAQSFVVSKAPLTVTAANAKRPFGVANPTLVYTVTGFVDGDTVATVSGSATLSTTATLTSPVGSYPITFATEGLTAANYSFSYAAGTLTVGSGSQTITFGPLFAMTYGAAPFSLTATASSGLAVNYTVTGPATVSGSTLVITGVGLVTVTASQAGSAIFSAAVPVSQSFTVSKAILTATAVNQVRALKAANPALTYKVSGFVGRDTSSVVSGTATLTTTATLTSPAGTYAISFATESLAATNYSFAYVAGTLTVLPPTSVAAPTFSPAGGTFSVPQTVMLGDASAGAAIHYTLDGSTPTINSPLYVSSIQVASAETITAIAIINGVSSATSSQTYTIAAGQCQTIDYSKGFTSTGLSLNGGAIVAGNELQLTDGGRFEARSAFSANSLPVSSYDTNFTFQILDPLADGLTFVIQSNSPKALGQTGGGLGYAGIPNSMAFKLDLHNNFGEGINSTGMYLDGVYPSTPSIDLTPTGINLHSGHVFAVRIAYANAVTVGTITDTVTGVSATGSFPGDIGKVVGNSAYVGFTGGTGNATSNASILTWSFHGGYGCSAQ